MKLSSSQLQSGYLFDDTCKLYIAEYDNRIIGYAFATHFHVQEGRVNWITQLVVRTFWRTSGVGKRLCEMAF